MGHTESVCPASICAAVQVGKPLPPICTPSHHHSKVIGFAARSAGFSSNALYSNVPVNGVGAFGVAPFAEPVATTVVFVAACDIDITPTATAAVSARPRIIFFLICVSPSAFILLLFGQ